MSVSWSFSELCVVVISAQSTRGGERAEWEGVCTVSWAHWKCSAAVRVEGCGTQAGDSHKPSRLAPRSVQTALACAFPQPSRKSKLHKVLKEFFIFSLQRIFFF